MTRRPAVLAIGALALLDLAYAAVLWPGIAYVNDYVGFVAAGKALLAGVDPYDARTWTDFALAVGQRPETPVFGYPPWIAVAFVPLGLLPTLVGSIVWTAGGMALATGATWSLARRFDWPAIPAAALALASWPALLVLVQGQWGFVLVALAILLLLDLDRRRDGRAGVWWALMILAKPQIVALGSVVLFVRLVLARRFRPVVVGLLVVAVAVAAGTLAAPEWIGPYLVHVVPHRLSRSTQQPTLAGLAGDVAGPLWPVAWVAFIAVLGAAIALAALRAPRAGREAIAFTGVLALTVVASPYSWSYDHYLAVPLGAGVVGLAQRCGCRTRTLLVGATGLLLGPIAFLLFESAYLRWHDTLAGLVPVAAIVLAAVAASAPRR